MTAAPAAAGDLAGGTTVNNFPTTTVDPFQPYTNTGPGPGTIELNALGPSVVVTEPMGAISQTSVANPIAVTINKVGSGKFVFQGDNTYSGVTTVDGGTLAVGSNLALGTGTLSLSPGATLQFASPGLTIANPISLPSVGAATFDTNAQTATISGGVSGLGGLTLTGGGTLVLQFKNNLYSGDTAVNNGTLKGGAQNAFSAGSATTIIPTGKLDLGGFLQTINKLTLAGGVIQNGFFESAGGISSSGGTVDTISGHTQLTTTAGTTILAGTNIYDGQTVVNGGILTGSAANTFSAASVTTVNTGGTLDLGGVNQTINNIYLQGGTIQNGTLDNSGALSNPLNSSGGTISGLTVKGDLTISNGATTLTGTSAFEGVTTVKQNAVLDNQGVVTVGSYPIGNSGTITNEGTYTTDVANNNALASVTNNAAGTWIGNASNSKGTIANIGTWTGAIDNGAAGIFSNTGATASLSGLLTTAGTATNSGALNGGVNVTGGTFDNQNLGTIKGGLTNSGGASTNDPGGVIDTATVTAGSLNNSGSITGAVINSATFANNAGGTVGGLLSNSGAVLNFGALNGGVASSGSFTNKNGATVIGGVTVTGGSTTNDGGGVIDTAIVNAGAFANSGSITGAVTNSAIFNNKSGGAVGGLLTNNATGTVNNSFQLNAGVGNAGAFNNFAGGAIAGGLVNGGGVATNYLGGTIDKVTNAAGASFDNRFGGTVTAGLANSGTVTNQGSIANGGGVGVINNTGGVFNNAGGTVSGGLTNNGTVVASGGAINGAVTNNTPSFTVNGLVTTDGAFNNAAGAVLSVTGPGGQYVVGGLVTNSGSIALAKGAVLDASASGITNTLSGSIFNNGKIYDALNNAGLVVNSGLYNADIASNTGTITNNPGAAWNGNVLAGANIGPGLITNFGTWTGTGNNDGGILNNKGTWTGLIRNNSGSFTNEGLVNGGVVNSATFNNSANAIVNGGLTNTSGVATNDGAINGAVTVTGGALNSFAPLSVINGNVTNSGIVNALSLINGNVINIPGASFNVSDATGLPASAGAPQKRLTVTGSVTGVVNIPSDLTTGASNYISVAGSIANATVNLTGVNLSNSGNKLWLTPNHTLTYSDVNIPLNASSQARFVAMSSSGPFDYTPLYNSTVVQSLKLGPAVAPTNQAVSVIGGLARNFYSDMLAYITVPSAPAPDTWKSGLWIRGGGESIRTQSTVNGGNAPTSTNTRFSNSFGGIQGGLDEGLYNIQNSGINAHLGLMGGEAFGSSSDDQLAEVSTKANVPFVGVYGALTGGGFEGTVLWSHSFINMTVSDGRFGGAANQGLDAQGDTFAADVRYVAAFSNGFSLTPLAAIFTSQTHINNLGTSFGSFSYKTIDSTLGRIGLKGAIAFGLSEDLIVSPYVKAILWRETGGNSVTTLTQGLNALPPVNATGAGTFGQGSLGFTTQSLHSGFSSFAQASSFVGSTVQGWALSAGMRYDF